MKCFKIIANPAAGTLGIDQKFKLLEKAADILNANVYGLDTQTPEEFIRCAQDVATTCDILVIAGGDGTLSGIINTIDTSRIPIAYLPLGTGNAVKDALNYRGNITAIARRIHRGTIHEFDLISCCGKKRAFMASVGIEGTAVGLWDHHRDSGKTGLGVYLKAGLWAYFNKYKPVNASVAFNGDEIKVQRLLSLMVVKQPYYGFGMKVVPKARWDDGYLHTLCLKAGLMKISGALVTSFSIGNRFGNYRPCLEVSIDLDRPKKLQIDGEYGWEDLRFEFKVLPKMLKMVY